jgi:splicing factor U2AF subunit
VFSVAKRNSPQSQIERYFTDVIERAVTFPGASNPGGDPPGPPVCNVYINHEKFFAFVELKSIELTQACLGLDGVKYHHK